MEVWKDIIGFKGHYLVSSLGRIKSLERVDLNTRVVLERIRLSSLNPNGYLSVSLWRKNKAYTKWVHRIVAEAFIPNPRKKRTVNHKNGIKKDNRAVNLEWMTDGENHRHAFKNGLREPTDVRGEKNPNSKLDRAKIIEIRDLISTGLSATEIAKIYHVTSRSIGLIKQRKTWIGVI